MAVYKVPQDVEADDKLIGPFSFRQFIYLIIAIIAIALAWGLAQLFIGLALIPLPFVVLFGALALPLKKDQPMETYLAAIVSFYLKPRKRFWQPDGIQSLVEITAPKVVEVHRTKDLSQSEAEQRLSYLANIVDTGGWAVRGVNGTPTPDSAMQNDVYYAAQQTEDMLDTGGEVAHSFETMIDQADAKRREEMLQRMRQAPQTVIPPRPADPYATLTPSTSTPSTTPAGTQAPDPHLTYNPYPTSMHQSVVNPLGTQPTPAAVPPAAPTSTPTPAPGLPPVHAPAPITTKPTQSPQSTSEIRVSPDIISLANNSDLSIETIAHEANRIHQKEEAKLPEDEVMISLR